ncbi:hypothetical protein ACFOU2_17580 [Bacillus songklensis]|uniref:Uncharacterized protein n=1 Tax=Bacillus songklensis TaxID=1069116 RepID=A0ABV8B748_9BACI
MPQAAFLKNKNQLLHFYNDGLFYEAFVIAEKTHMEHPDKRIKTTLWKARILCKLNHPEQAITELQSALSQNIWWHPNTFVYEPDFQPLFQFKSFHRFLSACEKKWRHDQRTNQAINTDQ